MITKELIERINYLSRKQRAEGLTKEESAEQAQLRRTYIEAIKSQVRSSLEAVKNAHQEHTHEPLHDHKSSKCSCSSNCNCH
ncbi:DUF896 domain-containing protein [Zhaonella formicivorans]|uniref:DUF896 domain-containing protein n=1 Tax=Zhaonella formicivorans TaxID=2528593 RepID=UPI0010EAD1A9|nr:DUF896 domain-containing protein [Zhaonella formicivorans]